VIDRDIRRRDEHRLGMRQHVKLGLNGSSKHLIREYRLEFSSLGSLEVEYLVSLPQHPVGPG
jgi:hypothetical protein